MTKNRLTNSPIDAKQAVDLDFHLPTFGPERRATQVDTRNVVTRNGVELRNSPLVKPAKIPDRLLATQKLDAPSVGFLFNKPGKSTSQIDSKIMSSDRKKTN